MTPQQTKETMEERFDKIKLSVRIYPENEITVKELKEKGIVIDTIWEMIKPDIKRFLIQEIELAQKEWCLNGTITNVAVVKGYEAGVEEGRRQREEEIKKIIINKAVGIEFFGKIIEIKYLINLLNKK
jgi:hypothetical protein